MRAVVYHAFGGPIAIESLPDPTASDDGVVVRVQATGLCRSDWHGWKGHDDDIRLPHVPGHELAGTIVAAGKKVRRFVVGERVTVPFCCGCGICPTCRQGNPHICDAHFQPGFTGWGSFAELVALRYADHNLVRLPADVTFETAASLGCRFVTAWRAVRIQAALGPGQSLAVHGCGGVGLAAIMIGRHLGARVIAVDVSAAALALAQALGAETLAANGNDEDAIATAIRDLTVGGADASLDALGSVTTCRQSILCLRKQGRHVQVGLLPGGNTPLPMNAVIGRELQILGSHGMQATHYPEVLEAIRSGRLRPQDLITRFLGLEDVPTALASMDDQPHAGVTMIQP